MASWTSRSTRPILASMAWCRHRRAIASPRPRRPRSGSRSTATISTSRPRSGTPRRPRSGLPTSCAATPTRCAITTTSASASTRSTTAAAATCSTPTRSVALPTTRWWMKAHPIPIGIQYGWPRPGGSTAAGPSRWRSRSSRCATPRAPTRRGASSFAAPSVTRTSGIIGPRCRATWPVPRRSIACRCLARWWGLICRPPDVTSRSSPTRWAAVRPTRSRIRRCWATRPARLVAT